MAIFREAESELDMVMISWVSVIGSERRSIEYGTAMHIQWKS